jgi:peptidoglycan/xylan/chitin deacetylase (PgdA/CDA1 family)
MIIPAILLACASGTGLAAVNPSGMDMVRQEVVVEFRTAAAVSQASVEVLPLFHGYAVAMSNRWDDNMMDDITIRDIMARHGQKATWFLTDPYGWTNPSLTGERLAAELLKGGNSIGGHSLTHPFLTYLNRNAAFHEVLGVRVAREVNSQSPVVSFGFPFLGKWSAAEGLPQQRDMAEMLRRAGYYHLSEEKFTPQGRGEFIEVVTLTYDGNPVEDRFRAGLATEREPGDKPLFTISMHAWPEPWGGRDFPKLREMYRKWSRKTDWWYCNMNEYAAYRYQYAETTMTATVTGLTMTLDLVRPALVDLNDAVPLSFRVSGVRPSEIASIRSGGMVLKRYGARETRFDLAHTVSQALPAAYGMVGNDANDGVEAGLVESPSLPGIRSRLFVKDGVVTLVINNPGSTPLTDGRVVFRLPLKSREGVVKRYFGSIGAGETGRFEMESRLADPDFLYSAGEAYYVAQIDATDGLRRVRLYSACRTAEGTPDHSYPRDAFLVLGPVPSDKAGFDFAAFTSGVLGAKTPRGCYEPFPEDRPCWVGPTGGQARRFTPDVIFTTGKEASPVQYTWDPNRYRHGKELRWIAWGTVASPDDRTAVVQAEREHLEALWVNGEKADPAAVRLRKGANDLRLLYYPRGWGATVGYDETFYGVFFRLVRTDGSRMTDLVYSRPAIPPPAGR